MMSIILALAMWHATAQSPRPTDPTPIGRYVQQIIDAGEMSGTVLVAKGSRILFQVSSGQADPATGRALTTDTPIAVASIVKPLTMIVAARLQDAGVLAASDRISRWFPDFPNADRITVDMLIRHRAGIPPRVLPAEEEYVPHTSAALVNAIAASPDRWEPGTRPLYSSMGFVLLARVLELASGQTYAELLRRHVLTPAGATHSFDATDRSAPRGHAVSFRLDHARRVEPRRSRDLSFLVGAGSLYSTPGDLHRIVTTLMSGGYGETARNYFAGRPIAWSGLTDGYRAFLDYDPADEMAVIYASNRVTGAAELLRQALPRLARGESVASPTIPRPRAVTLTAEARARIEGGYDSGGRAGQPIRLAFDSPSTATFGDFQLVTVDDSTFFSLQDYAEVGIVRESDGTVTRLAWPIGGAIRYFDRVKER